MPGSDRSIEEQRFSAIFHQALVGMAQTDLSGRFLLVNQRFAEMVGRSPEELSLLRMQDLTHPDDLAQSLVLFHRAATEGRDFIIEKRYVRPDGSSVWVHNAVSVLTDAEGRPQHIVAISQDITERKHSEIQLQEAVRLRDEFLSVASHELRTPLMSLTLQLELIHRDLSEESRRQVDPRMSAVRRQVGRLTLLVDNLLDVSRIAAGKLELELSDVDLVPLVRDVLDRMRGILHPSGSEVTFHAPPEPVVGHWDAARLDQVLMNLLGNAARYGQGRPITVSVRADNAHAWLSIRDEGIGIAPEDLERIFGRFERAVSRRHYGGLGLGLFITRQIVEALGGQVRVESEPGRGSLFEVRLPLSALR